MSIIKHFDEASIKEHHIVLTNIKDPLYITRKMPEIRHLLFKNIDEVIYFAFYLTIGVSGK